MQSVGQYIGIFGGSFDPVHTGHLLVAQAAIEELQLSRLFLIPAACSPFKLDQQPTPAAHRLAMLRLAFAGRTDCEVDDLEIQRGGTSFTIDTVRHFAQKYPGSKLFYLIGADNVPKLNQWRDANELAKLAEFIVIPRPGDAPALLPSPFQGSYLVDHPFGVSASQIRARAKANLPLEPLVPAAVSQFIRNNRLYQTESKA